jgi:hypothetical protein
VKFWALLQCTDLGFTLRLFTLLLATASVPLLMHACWSVSQALTHPLLSFPELCNTHAGTAATHTPACLPDCLSCPGIAAVGRAPWPA